LTLAILALSATRAPAAEPPYTQQQDFVFGESHGMGLVMDIFIPTGTKNGLAVIDVASGAWHSDRGKIRDHQRAHMYDIFCGKGYTVFAVRPGSITRFSIPDMQDNIKKCIVWVKKHATDYGIDPKRIGLTGASAGGHLASLAALTGEAGDPGTDVAAVAVFFPPTDFLNYRGFAFNAGGNGERPRRLLQMVAAGTAGTLTDEQLKQKIIDISPARKARKGAPPFLVIHGDADPLVPLSQSETLVKALKEVEVPAELIVKPGGGHPWPTIHEEVKVIADWFDKQLAGK
jgi:acetyl esterase/lipase